MAEEPKLVSPEIPPDDSSSRERAGAIERIFREHNETLVRFLMARLRSRSAALEVAQEAYVRLLSLDEKNTISYLRAFLFRTAANLAVDRLRREKVHDRATQLPLFHELVDHRTPDRRVAAEQELLKVTRILAALPPRCRQAFVLHRFDELDYSTIARKMKLSERMVRTYVVRALLFCRAQLDASPPATSDDE